VQVCLCSAEAQRSASISNIVKRECGRRHRESGSPVAGHVRQACDQVAERLSDHWSLS
jgi:hypothetical protein